MDIQDSRNSVKTKYSLTVTVEHRGIGRVFNAKRVAKEISLRNDPFLAALPVAYIAALPACKLYGSQSSLESRNARPQSPDCAPPYSPTLQVEAALTGPAVLVRGHATAVRVTIDVPTEILRGEPIYVRSVGMYLHSLVTAKLGKISRQVTATRHAMSVSGAAQIDSEHYELDCGSWGHLFIHDAQPTFESCAVTVTHTVEVVTGISKGLGGQVEVGI